MQTLFTTFNTGALTLQNRIVMAPMTRSRATNEGLVPTSVMAEYYAQRASAGLIITEATWINQQAVGYINIPGIFTTEQVEGWKLVTAAVHARGGKIFSQIGHSGAASHPDFFNGDLPLGPSAINPQVMSFTPQGFKETVTPRAFTKDDIQQTIQDYKQAALNAKSAGFDGVELHAQIYTLLPQFFSIATNQRTDEYGGSIPNRARLLFELLDVLIDVWGPGRVGVKFTPAAFNPGLVKPDEQTIDLYAYILQKLNDYPMAYVQLVAPDTDLTGTVIDAWKHDFFKQMRHHYKGTLMANGGFTQQSADAIIADGTAELVSFGKFFIANPDLPERFAAGHPLAESDTASWYAGDHQGYTDYPNRSLKD